MIKTHYLVKLLGNLGAVCLITTIIQLLILQGSILAGVSSEKSTLEVIKSENLQEVKDSKWKWGDAIEFYDGKLRWDFQMREQFEWRENWIDFNDNNDQRDDVALLSRIRLGLKWIATDKLTLYAQLQDSRTLFDEPQGPVTNRELGLNDSPIDLRHAWFKWLPLEETPLSLKVGRQIWKYGEGRLLGPGNWNNQARTFDSLKLRYTDTAFWLEYFAGYLVRHTTDTFNESDSEDLVTGLWANVKEIPVFDAHFYTILRSKSDVDVNTIRTNVDNQSSGNNHPAGDYINLGTLFKSKKNALGPWDFEAELNFQVGEISNPTRAGNALSGVIINTARQDHLAFASHLELGYHLDHAWKPRLYTEYNYASGDDNPGDGINNTFQNFHPANHGKDARYGIMDRFAWMNLHNLTFGLTIKPIKELDIRLAHHLFWLDSTNTPWRFAGQGAVGGNARFGNAIGRSVSNFVGNELNLIVNYKPYDWWNLQVGYAHFFAGNYIYETDPALNRSTGQDDADFLYVQSTISF
ncbi:MAG: alginate export family protein [Verrucomicrobiota bacterium]